MPKKKSSATKPEPFFSIREMLERTVAGYGDTVAYKFKREDDSIAEVTYAEFYERTESLGAALTALGFGGSAVACVSENRFEWINVYLTVLQSEGVFVPIDRELPLSDMLYLLADSESEVVFFSEKYRNRILENRGKLPRVKLFVCFDGEESADCRTLASLLADGARLDRAAYDAQRSDEHALKMLVYTSGTTGKAKGVMLTEHNLVSSVYYGVQVSGIFDTALSILPYNHTYESVCDILVNIQSHGTFCISRSIKDIVGDMKIFRPSNIYMVPAVAEFIRRGILRNLEKRGKKATFERAVKLSRAMLKIGIDLRPKLFSQILGAFGGRLRKIVCGGAPIRPEIGEFYDDLGIALTGGYGITECSPLISVNDEGSLDFHTAGHRLACLEWRIDEPNEEGIGEICVKGDVVMLGYYKNPEATAEAIRDGWFYTGDYGYLTPDDQVVITGRKKNIIVLSNGKNIYPEEIEGRLLRVEEIEEAVVRGLRDERGDESALAAEVYLNTPVEESELRKKIGRELEDLPSYKRIKEVTVRDEPFPKTTSNKIKRDEIRKN